MAILQDDVKKALRIVPVKLHVGLDVRGRGRNLRVQPEPPQRLLVHVKGDVLL